MSVPSRRRGRPRADERGQATVELALVLPVVVFLCLLVAQVGQVVRYHVLTVHAAREVARAAAVHPSAPDADEVADRHGLSADRLSVRVAPPDPDGFVRVELGYDIPTDVLLVGSFLPEVGVVAEAQMLAEWQPSH